VFFNNLLIIYYTCIMKKTLFTFLLTTLIFTGVSIAQKNVYLKGQIINETDQSPLYGSHILNLNSVVGITTDLEGRFRIPTNVSDTLLISYVGFQSIKLKITNDLLKGNELSITLHEKTTKISEIRIKSHQLIGVLEVDIKQVPKDRYSRIHINGLPQTYEIGKPSEKNLNTVTAAVFQPIDFLYNKFGKKPKSLRRLKKLKEKDHLRAILSNKFDREIMLEYLEMDEKQLNDLLDNCNYSEYFIRTASDLQVIEAVLDCYENDKALKKGSVQRK